ncbi:MAG: hypothetical protein RH860_16120 [Cytophagales bacterium]
MKNLNIPFWIKIILFYFLLVLAFLKNSNLGIEKSKVTVVSNKGSAFDFESNVKAENLIIRKSKP